MGFKLKLLQGSHYDTDATLTVPEP